MRAVLAFFAVQLTVLILAWLGGYTFDERGPHIAELAMYSFIVGFQVAGMVYICFKEFKS